VIDIQGNFAVRGSRAQIPFADGIAEYVGYPGPRLMAPGGDQVIDKTQSTGRCYTPWHHVLAAYPILEPRLSLQDEDLVTGTSQLCRKSRSGKATSYGNHVKAHRNCLSVGRLAKEPRKCWYHSGVFGINNHPCGKQKSAKKQMGYCETSSTIANLREFKGKHSLRVQLPRGRTTFGSSKRLEFANGVW
jgi:hypothetical protein